MLQGDDRMTASTLQAMEFQTVEIGRLAESRTNPRRHFGERGMEELVGSVRDHGVLNPLLVRPCADGGKGRLEIVCGSRRYRAAKTAGLKTIPVRMSALSDEQVLEIQVIENLQREDVHPLDEAAGYRALMETGRYTVESLAAKVGKSASYVYQRMKLTELVEAAKEAFWRDEITAGHAILLARLQPGDQKEALQTCAERGDLWSVRQLADWIAGTFHLRLSAAPFKPSDAELLAKAGACTACGKRTGANPELFPEVRAKDTCTDPACYRAKVSAFIAARTAEHEARGEKLQPVVVGWVYDRDMPKGALRSGTYAVLDGKEEPCPAAAPAIVVAGNDVGKVLRICAAPKCKVHRPGRDYGASPQAREAERRRKEAERQKTETYRRARAAMVEQVDKLGDGELRLLAEVLVRKCGMHDGARVLVKELELEPRRGQYGIDYDGTLVTYAETANRPALGRLMVNICLLALWNNGWNTKPFDEVAKARGVDVPAIARKVAAEAKAKVKAKAGRAGRKKQAGGARPKEQRSKGRRTRGRQ